MRSSPNKTRFQEAISSQYEAIYALVKQFTYGICDPWGYEWYRRHSRKFWGPSEAPTHIRFHHRMNNVDGQSTPTPGECLSVWHQPQQHTVDHVAQDPDGSMIYSAVLSRVEATVFLADALLRPVQKKEWQTTYRGNRAIRRCVHTTASPSLLFPACASCRISVVVS